MKPKKSKGRWIWDKSPELLINFGKVAWHQHEYNYPHDSIRITNWLQTPPFSSWKCFLSSNKCTGVKPFSIVQLISQSINNYTKPTWYIRLNAKKKKLKSMLHVIQIPTVTVTHEFDKNICFLAKWQQNIDESKQIFKKTSANTTTLECIFSTQMEYLYVDSVQETEFL